MKKDSKCPCGSGKNYGDCCGPIHAGVVAAPTAEALMRARYSAYVTGDIDFIAESCVRADSAPDIDLEETQRWSKESQWHGLVIHSATGGSPTDTEGVVEFSANYSRGGLREEHRERASFKKIEGKWVYTDGSLATTTVVRDAPKVGRNDPCTCGSGKKYKKCCGK
ncbi:MAG TPA: YchJ family protein [Treponema sp.]|nr:YchJ family protein [Treponema sp.]